MEVMDEKQFTQGEVITVARRGKMVHYATVDGHSEFLQPEGRSVGSWKFCRQTTRLNGLHYEADPGKTLYRSLFRGNEGFSKRKDVVERAKATGAFD